MQGSPARPSIVCGVDSSEDARVALRVAAELSTALALRLVAVHVSDLSSSFTGQTAAATEDERVARVQLRGLLESEGLREVEARVTSGVPASAIARLAEAEGARLIVVGSRGHGALKAAFLGSVSRDLIAAAPCPVVVVPRGVDV
jgi:nucleotide-binding universal stress UspA family protein